VASRSINSKSLWEDVPSLVENEMAVPFTGSYDPVVKEKGEPPWREPTRREVAADREQGAH
jgi:hypothetical protein